MKMFKKNSRSPLILAQKPFNILSVLGVLILFISISGFISVNETSSEDLFMRAVVLNIEVTNHLHSPPLIEDMQVSVADNKIIMDILPGESKRGKGKMIFRGDKGKKGEIYLIDDDKKEYYVMDDAFVKSMKGNLNKSKKMMDDALKNLTPKQREMIEKMQKESGGAMPGMVMMGPRAKPETIKTGDRGTKAGYPCVKYEVLLEGRKIRELWVTDWNNVEGGSEIEDAFKEMSNFYSELLDSFEDMIGGGLNPYSEMNFDKGFPVVTQEFNEDDGTLESETMFRGVSERDLDPEAFEPPKGYRLRTMGPQ